MGAVRMMFDSKRAFPVLLAAWALTAWIASARADTSSAATDTTSVAVPPIDVGHGPKGWYLRSPDGLYSIEIDARLQFRYATPRDSDPVTFDDFRDIDEHVLKVNRARLKVGGNTVHPWLRYYFEYELAASKLLDFRVWITRWSALRLKVGQWKAQYSRERIISSGKQQLVDRSLINRKFTIDRQQGLSLFGRLEGGGVVDLSYWMSVFTGSGRGNNTNGDSHLMWMTRLQWNPFGRVLEFSGSDTARHEAPTAGVTVAAVTNRSPYTRFSTSGGGELEGFEPGEPGQYRVDQAMFETAFMWRGLSWQQELHWKSIEDRINGGTTILRGNYAQLGYFLGESFPRLSDALEIAARHAIYSPDKNDSNDIEQEFSVAANWFFVGHRNKLSAEVSHFDFRETRDERRDGTRFRLQWDLSI
jgi:phosphate-selective porin